MQTTLDIKTQFDSFDSEKAIQHIQSEADWVGLRFYQEKSQQRVVRNQAVEQSETLIERGAMIEVIVNGNLAYSATSDLSISGLKLATQRAKNLAEATSIKPLLKYDSSLRPQVTGRYKSPRKINLDQLTLAEFTDKQFQAARHLKINDSIVNAEANAMITETEIQYVTSSGTKIAQDFLLINHGVSAVAKNGNESQKRSLNGFRSVTRQSGLEIFDWDKIYAECSRIGQEAYALTTAENCPTAKMDLIVDSDQMYMQIHESIGHPLELDRILGDERNYAGWSFIQPKDFGQLQYGSKLMNVTFDPGVPGEYASYAFDDCGNPATKQFLIKDGLLLRGLGSLESQKRLNLDGVANFRSASWNRAPIDRMANINIEPGESGLQKMVSQIENGIFVTSNSSWSIDDYRNKFQFGCEMGRLIENGRLTKIVKNPNYRGRTIPFWNSLKAVGNKNEVGVFGSPYCGKGEPSQVIRVGHSSPPCWFSQVEVFGGNP